MPTKNPRLTMTLSPPMAEKLRRISELTGNSQASLISDLLEGCTSVFDRLILVLEAAETAKAQLVPQFADDMEASQAEMEKRLFRAFADFEKLAPSEAEHAESIPRRGRKGIGSKRLRDEPMPTSPPPVESRAKRRSQTPAY